MREKVGVAFSGGADSTFTLINLLNMGYNVEAFNFPIGRHVSEHVYCITDKLGVKLHIIDIRNTFDQVIKEYFYSAYLKGLTPNPCVRCNRYIKFGLLHTIIKNKYKIDMMATGHYAKIIKDDNNRYFIQKAKDKFKDQTYFLWGIPKAILKDILFPIGDFTKEEVKDMLKQEGFKEIANKEESFDICFVNQNSYKEYIEKYGMNQKKEQGYYVDDSGTILGRHGGIHKYTVGQRKGLTLAFGKRMYVRKIDYQKNQIVLGDKPFTKFVIANNINLFIDETQFLDDYQYTAKIRYKSKEGKAKVNLIIEDKSKKLQVEFLNDVEASSCGQSLVIYHEDRIVGGGIIEKLVIH